MTALRDNAVWVAIVGALITAVWWQFLQVVAQGQDLAALRQQIVDMRGCEK